jgi:hypothetical protein
MALHNPRRYAAAVYLEFRIRLNPFFSTRKPAPSGLRIGSSGRILISLRRRKLELLERQHAKPCCKPALQVAPGAEHLVKQLFQEDFIPASPTMQTVCCLAAARMHSWLHPL